MLDGGVESREKLPVARVVTRPLVVLSRKGFDGLDRIPQGERREFDLGAFVLTEQPDAAIAGRAGVVGQTGLLQILDVSLPQRFPHRPTPHSRDHRVLLQVSAARDRSGLSGHDIASAGGCGSGGNGTNSALSRSGSFMRPARQSALACSMRSWDDDTKFHSMKRSPTGAPPSAITTLGVVASSTAGAPRPKTAICVAETARPPAST